MDATLIAIRLLHLVAASILLGGRVASAWLFERLVAPRDPALAARGARALLTAELVLVAPAVGLQLVTGIALADAGGIPLAAPWLAAALVLFAVAGLAWAPLLVCAWRMAGIAERCARDRLGLPGEFERRLRLWRGIECALVAAVLVLFWLMLARPAAAT